MTSDTKKNRTSPISDFGLTFGAFTFAGNVQAGVEVSTGLASSFRGCGRDAC
jgi:hypothetical protein